MMTLLCCDTGVSAVLIQYLIWLLSMEGLTPLSPVLVAIHHSSMQKSPLIHIVSVCVCVVTESKWVIYKLEKKIHLHFFGATFSLIFYLNYHD